MILPGDGLGAVLEDVGGDHRAASTQSPVHPALLRWLARGLGEKKKGRAASGWGTTRREKHSLTSFSPQKNASTLTQFSSAMYLRLLLNIWNNL